MLSQILHKHSDIIINYEVLKYYQGDNDYFIIVNFYLISGYCLFVKDYLFDNGLRTYSFHFQDSSGQLIFRYDTAPHWKDIGSFPYHKHFKNKIEPSQPMNIDKIFNEVETFLKSKIKIIL